MTDPRNVAHDKRVQVEKKHKGEDIAKDTTAAPQPGKKPHKEHHASDKPKDDTGTTDTDGDANA